MSGPNRRPEHLDRLTRTVGWLLAAAMVAVGITMLAITIGRGGGPLSIGVIFGVLFAAAGIARGWLLRQERS